MIRTEVIPHVGGSGEEGRLLGVARMLLLTPTGSQITDDATSTSANGQRSRCSRQPDATVRQLPRKFVAFLRELFGSWRQDGRP
jgi:hypothetical protein